MKYYSHHGEELVTERILYILERRKVDTVTIGCPKKYKRTLTYVDIGAGDPIDASNTYFYYLMGYKGLVIEGASQYIAKFKEIRPNDIFLHTLVSDKDGEEKTLCNYAVIGTWLGDKHAKNKDYKRETLKTRTLTSIIKEYPAFAAPDVCNIDIDCSEELLLKGTDFNVFKPCIILIENTLDTDQTFRWERYINPSYHYIGNVGGNGIYIRKEWFYYCFVDEHNRRPVHMIEGFKKL